jgi:hypothetical protein
MTKIAGSGAGSISQMSWIRNTAYYLPMLPAPLQMEHRTQNIFQKNVRILNRQGGGIIGASPIFKPITY